MRITALLFVAALALPACNKDKASDSGDKKTNEAAQVVDVEALGAACEAANAAVGAATKAGGDFMGALQKGLTGCSTACDAKHDASCVTLKKQLGVLCGVSKSVCTTLCDTVKSPSLKENACALAKK